MQECSGTTNEENIFKDIHGKNDVLIKTNINEVEQKREKTENQYVRLGRKGIVYNNFHG